MKNKLRSLLNKEKLLLLGFGREGKSTYKLLREFFPEKIITIADKNQAIKEDPLVKFDPNVVFILGADFLQQVGTDYDLIIKSPGISLKDFPALMAHEKMTSQTDLFLQVYGKQTVGVTGTKGKSTTSTLLYHILKAYFSDVVLIGNIGVPPFTVIDGIDEETLIVCELSSHQLEFLHASPRISILLNFFQEHLDHYENYEAYRNAKWNIARHQTESDYFIFCQDNELLMADFERQQIRSQCGAYSLRDVVNTGVFLDEGELAIVSDGVVQQRFAANLKTNLKGEHNLQNIMAAILVCRILKIPELTYLMSISTFQALPHRIEYVGKFAGVDFYNDSISTIPEATIAAINTLQDVDTLVLGGFDRGIDYMPLGEFLAARTFSCLIFVGEAGQRIFESMIMAGQFNAIAHFPRTYEEVVDYCYAFTPKQGICLLSPAASSYDQFENFEHRGETFKKYVREKSFDYS